MGSGSSDGSVDFPFEVYLLSGFVKILLVYRNCDPAEILSVVVNLVL